MNQKYAPRIESETGLPNAGPMLLSTIKNQIVSIFPISQFITFIKVLKFYIIMLNLWISVDS